MLMDVLHTHCAGLDIHKDTVVACSRRVTAGKVIREVRTFKTTTSELLALSDWLGSLGATHIAMEATGVYWKPVWNILSDGDFELILANAAHVKNVPGRKTDVNDARSERLSSAASAHFGWLTCSLMGSSARASCPTLKRKSNAGCCARASS